MINIFSPSFNAHFFSGAAHFQWLRIFGAKERKSFSVIHISFYASRLSLTRNQSSQVTSHTMRVYTFREKETVRKLTIMIIELEAKNWS